MKPAQTMILAACCRYGYGFVQGASAAAAELNEKVEMNYSWLYGSSFAASPELQTMANLSTTSVPSAIALIMAL